MTEVTWVIYVTSVSWATCVTMVSLVTWSWLRLVTCVTRVT